MAALETRGAGDDDPTQQLTTLKEQLNGERTAREKAEKVSAVERALSGFNFASPTARTDAANILQQNSKRRSDGTFVINGVPLEAWAKDKLPSERGYLLAPERGPGGSTGATGGKRATTEMIKIGMSAEDRAAVMSALSQSLSSQQ
jgi:hypothetical protein